MSERGAGPTASEPIASHEAAQALVARRAGAERLALGMIDTMDAPPRARWRLDENAVAPVGFANTRAGF